MCRSVSFILQTKLPLTSPKGSVAEECIFVYHRTLQADCKERRKEFEGFSFRGIDRNPVFSLAIEHFLSCDLDITQTTVGKIALFNSPYLTMPLIEVLFAAALASIAFIIFLWRSWQNQMGI